VPARKEAQKRRRLRPEARRAELLSALERVLGREGHAGATVPKVVAEAGAAQGSFYRYFRDIDDAFVALTHELLTPVVDAVLAMDPGSARTPSDLEAALLPFYRAFAAQLAAHPAAMHEALIAASSERGEAGRVLALALDALRGRAEDLLRLELGGRRIEEPRLVSAAVLGMALGAAHEATRLEGRFDTEAWAKTMARFETGGLMRVARVRRVREGGGKHARQR